MIETKLDIYILIYLGLSFIIGAYRGFSGELGSTIKLIVTSAISYFIIFAIKDKLGASLLDNLFVPIAIFSTIYFIIGFIIRFFTNQLVFLIRSILPSVIDKPLGVIFAISKAIAIILLLSFITNNLASLMKIGLPEIVSKSSLYELASTKSEKIGKKYFSKDEDKEKLIEKILSKSLGEGEPELKNLEDLEKLPENKKQELLQKMLKKYNLGNKKIDKKLPNKKEEKGEEKEKEKGEGVKYHDIDELINSFEEELK